MKAYFRYLIKKRLPIYLSLFVIYLLCFLIINSVSRVSYFAGHGRIRLNTNYFMLTYYAGLGIGLFAIGLFEFSFKMNKITAAQAYSFPMKREKFYLCRFIFGYLEVVIPFTIAMFISLIPFVIEKESRYFILFNYQISKDQVSNLAGVFPFYFSLIFVGFLVYSFEVFFYCQANTFIDGIVTVAMAAFVLLPYGFIIYPYSTGSTFSVLDLYWLSSEVGFLTIDGSSSLLMDGGFMVNLQRTFVVIYVIAGLACFVGQYFASKNFKSEDAGQRSESWFCYRILLPLTGIGFCYLSKDLLINLMIMVATFLVYVLYKRTIKFDLKTIIVMICVLTLEMLMLPIASLDSYINSSSYSSYQIQLLTNNFLELFKVRVGRYI